MPQRAWILIVLWAFASACGSGRRPGGADAVRVSLEPTPAFVGRSAGDASAWKATRRFYRGRAGAPAWLDGRRPASRADDLIEALLRAGEHGLEPTTYGASELLDARRQLEPAWPGTRPDPLRSAAFDARLTFAFVRFANDLSIGRVSARNVYGGYAVSAHGRDAVALLEAALKAGNVRPTLEQLVPSHPQYSGLQQALARYRAGIVDPGAADHPDGAQWRARQIEMNLERWRWMPRDLGARHILVNVAAYALLAIESYRPVLAMRVVVGEPSSPTPLFSDRMKYVVFSPYWNIPERILREETLADIAEDPEFLSRVGIEIVRTDGNGVERVDPATIDWTLDPVAQGLRFRQVPGPENALGLVKFIFPNHFGVYLHDTPDPAPFNRDRRAYSHGCVRVEDPVALAEYVLRDSPGWTRSQIVSAMHLGQENVVTLGEPIPVHLGYWTAWVERDGTVTFTDDPYRLDRKRDAALRRARPPIAASVRTATVGE